MFAPLLKRVFANVRHCASRFLYCYRPQRSCGKVMSSQASVILFTGGGGRAWREEGVHVRGGGMHGREACMAVGGEGVRDRRDGHCSGRYASYWNAFLLKLPSWRFSS